MRRAADQQRIPVDGNPGFHRGDDGAAASPDARVEELFGGGRGPSLGRGYERLTHHLFQVDEWGEYEDLEKRLRLGKPAHRAEHAELMDAAEETEDCARRAHRLYVNAVVALEVYDADVEAIEATLRDEARALLEQEKEDGVRKKQITDGDVRAQMAASYPDQVRDHAQRKAKAKGMVGHLERLADLWKIRCRKLEVLLATTKR